MLRITLREIEVFTAIALHGSVTQAADVVGLTQSAASQALGRLEESLGLQLFDRIGKRLTLNEHGRSLYSRASILLDSARNIEDSFVGGSYNLKLGASMTISNYILPERLAAFRLAQPTSQIEMVVGNTQEIIRAVANLTVDFALIEGPCHHPELLAEPWATDELIVFAAANHPMTQRTVSLDKLAAADWLLRETGSATRDEVERLLLPHLPKLSAVLEFGHPEAIKNAVASGLGVSCLSKHVIARELESKVLKPVKAKLPKLERMLYSIRHRDKMITPTMQAFLQ